MRTILVLLALLVSATLNTCQAQTVPVRFSWTYNYSPFPACPTATATGCVSGFNIYNATTPVHTLWSTAPNPPNATGPAVLVVFTAALPLAAGNYRAVVTAVLRPASGGPTVESLDSNEAPFVVTIRPPTPGSFQAAPQ